MQESAPPHIDYRQLYDQQLVIMEQLTRQLASHVDREAALSAEIARLRKLIFGVKVERFVPSAEVTAAELQLALDLQAETAAHCKLTGTATVECVRAKVEIITAKSWT